jgi:hypothetical protein
MLAALCGAVGPAWPAKDIMRTNLAVLAAVGVLTAALCGCSQEARQHAADERLRAIYTTEWKWRTEQ